MPTPEPLPETRFAFGAHAWHASCLDISAQSSATIGHKTMKATIYSVTCGGRSRRVSRSELAAMLRAWRAQGAYIELLGASRFRVTAASSYDVRAVA